MSSHHHEHCNHSAGSSNLKVAFFLNTFFTIIEIIGGLYTNSTAILSDAIHDFGDSLSLGMAWYFEKLSKKHRTDEYTFGFRRYSLIGAIINAFILLAGSLYMLTESIPRLFNPVQPETKGMIVLAILGILVNGVAVLRLKKGKSINEKVVMIHLMEDVLGWVAVLIVSIVLNFYNLPILDPLLSIVITGYIFFNAVKNLRLTFTIILQKTPDNVNPQEIKRIVEKIEGVKEVYDIHSWTMDGEYNVLTMHLVCKSDYNSEEIKLLKQKIRTELCQIHINHSTIEVDTEKIHLDPH